MNRETLLEQLNESQRQAVEYCDGPQLVIAGAGSGKTRVLTYKIAYLLTMGMKPWNILALTFTNKAAKEMKARIGRLVGEEMAQSLYMGTFHSVFARILRAESQQLGFNSNFTIYDESDSRSLIKSIAKELDLDEKVYKPAAVHHRISMAKNRLITAQRYAEDMEATDRDSHDRMPAIWKIFLAYEQRCQKANAMDFDDLLVLTYRLFCQEEIRQRYAHRFQYVLVDEYQDTNYAQQQIVLQLTKEHQHVCVVGDDAQSIYAFRGANIDNILDFQKVFPSMKLFKLEQNYRSTQRIVQAANSLIKKNERQIQKDVYSRNDEGDKLVLKNVYSDKEEASVVCKDIQRIKRQEGCKYEDFAILYRTNSQSRSFEEEMRKQSIPYRIYGGLSFYQRKEIKDIIAYFRLVANPDDEEAFKRIINYPARGIGNTTIQKIADCAQTHGVSFWEVIGNPRQYSLNVNGGTLNKINVFRQMIQSFVDKMNTMDAYELGREIIKESGISADLFAGNDTESLSRQENLEELLNSLQEFVEGRREEGKLNEVFIPDFLQEVSLLTDLDSDDHETSKVSLMTIHAAKGLEFPTVFIVGMEENIFPSPMSSDTLRGLEEERRLFYVAITRAEKHCLLTCAKSRWRYGKLEFSNPSRFLRDIDPRLMDVEGDSSSNDFGQRGYGYRDRSEWMQNSRPVASQFRADVKPKITAHRKPETPVDPFSDSFKRQLAQAGGNFRKVQTSPSSYSRSVVQPTASAPSTNSSAPLHEGNIIEHQRFGIGTVLKVEGTGENTKATVEFKNTGIKQLLLKFAKYTIVG